METLDFLVRGVMIPGIWIFIFTEVPECNDILKEFLRFVKRRRRIKRKKELFKHIPGQWLYAQIILLNIGTIVMLFDLL